MRSVLKEPLLHFLLVGAALFSASAWFGGSGDGAREANREVVVTQGRVHSLTQAFTRQWNRAPSHDELDALVRAFVREEVMAREALALGLDRDDTVVRRRLAQKMEFLSDDVEALAEPAEDELRAWLAAHPERFRTEPRYTFSQVFLDPRQRGQALATDAQRLLARLESAGAAADPGALGDSRMLPTHWAQATGSDIVAQLGAAFAARLEELPAGRWIGPVPSAYGVHLVRLEARVPAQLPAYEDVRAVLARDWAATKERELKEARYQALLAKYQVSVEPPSGASAPAEELASK